MKFTALAILCALLSSMAASQTAKEGRLYLVVAASESNPAAIALKANALAPKMKNALIVQTRDCKEDRNMYALVTEISKSRESAQAALGSARVIVPDSYVKICDVLLGSTLDLRIPAVDPSIANVPSDAVNWTDEDRITTAQPLADGSSFVIMRYYVNDPNDALEGRRERVILAKAANDKTVLDEQCANPGKPTIHGGRIAFTCAREQAGDHILHTTVVSDPSGRKAIEVTHCRNPKWVTDLELSCDAEAVDAAGKLLLKANRIELK